MAEVNPEQSLGGAGPERNEPQEDGKIFLGGLNKTTTKESIEQYCREWGEPKDVVVMDSKGYGFVSFVDIQDAFRFLERGQHSLDGRMVDVKAAMPKSRGGSKDKGLKMFIGGLPRQTSKSEVMARFSQYGAIDECNVVGENAKGPRGFAFVTFKEQSSMEKALIVKHSFQGKTVECKRAISKEEHEAMASSGMRGGPQGAGGPAPRGGGYSFSPDGKYQGSNPGYRPNVGFQHSSHNYGHGPHGRQTYPPWRGGGFQGGMNTGYSGEPWMASYDNMGGYKASAADRSHNYGAPGGYGYDNSAYSQGGYNALSGGYSTDGYNPPTHAGAEDSYGRQLGPNGHGHYEPGKGSLNTYSGEVGYGPPMNANNRAPPQNGTFGQEGYASGPPLNGGFNQVQTSSQVGEAGYGPPASAYGGSAQNGYGSPGGHLGAYGGSYDAYNLQHNSSAAMYGANGMPGPPSKGGYSGPPQRYTPY